MKNSLFVFLKIYTQLFTFFLIIIMETSQSLSIESFSYSWLVNLGDSFRASTDDDYETAFIEMDPTLPPSKRFFNVNPQDLNFDFPTFDESPLSTLVHADELISNGFLMPLFIKKPMKMESNYDVISDSTPNSPTSSLTQNESRSSRRVINRCVSLRRCRSMSRRILTKYLDFLRPFCQKIRRCRLKCRSGSSRMEEVKKWEYSPATSPRTSAAYSVDNWRRSCDSESSIYEAVLHCKRTINGK